MSKKRFFSIDFIQDKLSEKYAFYPLGAVMDINELAEALGTLGIKFWDFRGNRTEAKKQKAIALEELLESFSGGEALGLFSEKVASGVFNPYHDFWLYDLENPDELVSAGSEPFKLLAVFMYNNFDDDAIYNFLATD